MNNKNKIKFLISAFFCAIRPIHFAKNLLVFIPLLVGHHYFETTSLKRSIVGFVSFCLLAASVYLINDVVDLKKDQQHFLKKNRPFASGVLPLSVAYIGAPILLLLAIGLACLLPVSFLLVISFYFLFTLLYSFYIKSKKWYDVCLLAVLYTLRVIGGMTLVYNGYSLWLINFSLFFFLSLALLKRYIELQVAHRNDQIFIIGRAYKRMDLIHLFNLGKISASLAVLIFIFYIHSQKVLQLYQHPKYLWLVCAGLVYWLMRLWRLAQTNKLAEDPVVSVVFDKLTWIIAVLIAFISFFAR